MTTTTTTTTRFAARKLKILEQLDAPEGDYHDLSPKGSIDAPIRDLIGEINGLGGLVTTSSCSGRISVFLEGRKAGPDGARALEEGEETRAGPGGKGGGGTWLFISHDAVEVADASASLSFTSKFGLERTASEAQAAPDVHCRYIHLKFEPMILHVLSASLDEAQRVLSAALSAGFRESGAVSLGSTKAGEANPIVAVRSAGYAFDTIIGYQDQDGRNLSLIDESHMRTLVCIANERFKINFERIARFRAALLESYHPPPSTANGPSNPDWEDADARKRRKREEGLARQQALQSASAQEPVTNVTSTDLYGVDQMAQ